MELVIAWLGLAIAAGIVAVSKARSGLGWFTLGLLLPVIALLMVGFMPSLRAVSIVGDATPETHVKCSDCKELVLKDARVCKHCSCKLVPQLA